MALHDELDVEQGKRSLIEFTPLRSSLSQDEYDDDDDEDFFEEKYGDDSHQRSPLTQDHPEDSASPPSSPRAQNYHAVLQVTVPNEQRRFYEKTWLPNIFQLLKTVQGFRNRYVEVGSSNEDSTEYVIVLIFDNLEHFKAWEASTERKEIISVLPSRQIVSTFVNAYGGSITGNSDTDSLAQNTSKKISLQNTINQVPRALPPPKWKLCLVIVTAVYSALLITGLSGSVDVMLAAGMPLGLVLFLSISHTVTLLSFAGLPLLMSIPFVNSWLRLKRRCKPADMHPLHAVLDQGFDIFSVKLKAPEVPAEVREKIQKLEVRVDKLLGMNTRLHAELKDLKQGVESLAPPSTSNGSVDDHEEFCDEVLEDVLKNNVEKMVGSIASHRDSRSKIQKMKSQGELVMEPEPDLDAPLTMACRHYVKWEHQLDFENWCKEIDAEMKK